MAFQPFEMVTASLFEAHYGSIKIRQRHPIVQYRIPLLEAKVIPFWIGFFDGVLFQLFEVVFLPLEGLSVVRRVGTEVGTGRDKRSDGGVDEHSREVVLMGQIGGIKPTQRTGDETGDGMMYQKMFHVLDGCIRCNRMIGEEKVFAIMFFQEL